MAIVFLAHIASNTEDNRWISLAWSVMALIACVAAVLELFA